MKIIILTVVLTASLSAQWKAGVASVEITPAGPVWMGGYAARTKPSEGVRAPLFVKAIAFEDSRRERVVIVGADVIGWPRAVSERIAVAALKQYSLERKQLLLNASHTHSGPVVWPNLSGMYPMNEQQRADVEAFTNNLVEKTLDAIGAALGRLAPAELVYSTGTAKFASHRRLRQPDGSIQNAPNPGGPVDHTVPVLAVRAPQGQLSALLFSYSCHNTTMTGQYYELHGDYSGFAQANIEKAHPGVIAVFATACAGDQNPNPRGQREHVEAHGRELAAAVEAALAAPNPQRITGPLRTGFIHTELSFQPFGPNDFAAERQSENRYAAARAEAMLKLDAERRLPRRLHYPVQVIKLGTLGMVGLGGEVVVDYCLRLKRELAPGPLMVFGYSNDVMSYIPTAQQVAEGGYEANESFIYYQQPAPLAAKAEEEVVGAVKALWQRVK
jgi:hypothetical protein